MRKIAISAGHTNQPGMDQGCDNGHDFEGQYAVELRDLVKKYLEANGVKVSVDPNNSPTGSTVKLFRQYFFGSDICVDIHFNSNPKKSASGSETVIPALYSQFEHDLATELTAAVSSTLGIRNRGVITELQTFRKKLLWMTLKCETVLLEVCFLSNDSDMMSYKQRRNEVAKAIATILFKYRSL